MPGCAPREEQQAAELRRERGERREKVHGAG